MMLKKMCSTLVGLIVIPIVLFGLDVQLTDSLQRITTGFQMEPSLSHNGNKAYIVYPINVDVTVSPPINLVAEIFHNQNGQLQSVATLTGDVQFPIIDDGFASPDFQTFSLLDDNGLGTLRVRLFDQNLNQIAETFFNDYAFGSPTNPSFSALGGSFSDDNQFLVLSYLINATPNHQQTVVRVLNAHDLSEVASAQVSGGSTGTTFFSHRDVQFVAFTTYEGDFVFEFENPLAAPPPRFLCIDWMAINSQKRLKQSSLSKRVRQPFLSWGIMC